MRVKKAGGRVYGADMSAAEKKAAEYDRKHALEIDAMILWVLHQQLGWGEKRLRKFYDNFAGEIVNIS